jgi:hypothetical protein
MDAAVEFNDQFMLGERRNPPEAPEENAWDLIRYPDLCHEQQ